MCSENKILVSNITKKIKKILLSEDIVESYTKNGFAIVKNIVPTRRINSLLENIFNLFCKYSEDYQDLKNIEQPWNTELFHKKLIELRQKDPESFGAIYDSLKTSLTLTQLVTDDKVVDHIVKFLKIKSNNEDKNSYFDNFQKLVSHSCAEALNNLEFWINIQQKDVLSKYKEVYNEMPENSQHS